MTSTPIVRPVPILAILARAIGICAARVPYLRKRTRAQRYARSPGAGHGLSIPTLDFADRLPHLRRWPGDRAAAARDTAADRGAAQLGAKAVRLDGRPRISTADLPAHVHLASLVEPTDRTVHRHALSHGRHLDVVRRGAQRLVHGPLQGRAHWFSDHHLRLPDADRIGRPADAPRLHAVETTRQSPGLAERPD